MKRVICGPGLGKGLDLSDDEKESKRLDKLIPTSDAPEGVTKCTEALARWNQVVSKLRDEASQSLDRTAQLDWIAENLNSLMDTYLTTIYTSEVR